MSRYDRIETALRAKFAPEALTIIDETALHAGHAGQRGVTGGETHYQVTMVAAAMAGLSRLDRQRAVNDVLAGEFASGLHALSLTLKAPAEV